MSYRTGLHREGMYAGANSLITQSVISIAQAVFLGILAAFGYNQNLAKGAQSFNVQTRAGELGSRARDLAPCLIRAAALLSSGR